MQLSGTHGRAFSISGCCLEFGAPQIRSRAEGDRPVFVATRIGAVPLVVLVLVVWLVLPGCSVNHYFRQADREAKCLIAEKSFDPRWAAPPDFNVRMDPRSRFYDPCNPVRPPMPPDDPASHRYMHCVDGKKGYPRWHAYGDRCELENPEWRNRLGQYVELTDEGAVKLSVKSSVRLAYVNAPEYQDQLETLYLSALDVSTERFRFDVQFFGTNNTTFTHQGRLSAGGETNTLETDTNLQLNRRFATAGELVVGLANSIVWQFAGPDTFSDVSILNFNLVQPLLRGAGRDVALEQLTIVERALLANLRALQNYRQGLYTRIAIGDFGATGLQRRGGFFGGTGLTGFTGTGSGGFGGVGGTFFAATGGVSIGTSGFAGGGAGQVGGLVGMLQLMQQIHNTREHLNAQLRALGLLEAHLQAGTIDMTQVDQFRQSIETDRAVLLQSQNAMQSALESYKTSVLGMPPDLPMELDDGMIHQFRFIDPALSALQNQFADFLSEFGQEPAEPEIEVLQRSFDPVARLCGLVEQQAARVEGDLEKLHERSGDRQVAMTPAERRLFVKDTQKLPETLEELKQRLQQAPPRIDQLREGLTLASRRRTADRLVQLVTEVARIADELSLVQARARVETILMEPVRLSPDEALDIARANRLDWMNNRAALVDTWRLIQFNADALRAGLDVVFSGDMSTVGNNPVQFRAPTGSLRVGLRLDAPFTRLLERNSFRQSLIDYQRNRRQLIRYEDSVQLNLRELLRHLDELRVNLEIQRRAVVIAIRRVDRTREVLNQPPPPAQPGQPASQLGPTAALDLLSALADLRNSQNNLMSVWLNFYATRMRLARELGTMQLDECGMWIDRPLAEAERLDAEEVPLPPAVPDQWIEQLAPPAPASGGEGPLKPASPLQGSEDAAMLLPAPGALATASRASVFPPWRSTTRFACQDPSE